MIHSKADLHFVGLFRSPRDEGNESVQHHSQPDSPDGPPLPERTDQAYAAEDVESEGGEKVWQSNLCIPFNIVLHAFPCYDGSHNNMTVQAIITSLYQAMNTQCIALNRSQ